MITTEQGIGLSLFGTYGTFLCGQAGLTNPCGLT